nr:RagB/SusD family nutrient uptake outer membrane protein [Saprospiraceae bacterium]
MKKIINISLIFILGVLSACTDLDVTPKNDLTPDVFFTEDDAYARFLDRIYAGLAVTGQQGPAGNADIKGIDEGFSQYIRQYWQLQELSTDEAVIAWVQDDGLFDLHDHSWGSANPFVRATYYRIFFQVSLANEFLRESTDDKLD